MPASVERGGGEGGKRERAVGRKILSTIVLIVYNAMNIH